MDLDQLGPDEARELARKLTASVAQAILEGRMGLILGARELKRLACYAVPDWRTDKDLVVMGALDSETDHLPVGAQRGQWDAATLPEKDLEIARRELAAAPAAHSACRSLITRFGAD